MNTIAHLILIVFIKVSTGQYHCVIEQPTINKWEKQIVKDIVFSSCNNVAVAPKTTPNETLTTVNVKFRLKYFTLSDDGILVMHLWLYIAWRDERLKWNPENYGEITQTQINDQLIWVPLVDVLNGLHSTFDMFHDENCDINSTGDVSCIHRSYSETPCNIKLTNFPYDAQECSVEFGASGGNNSFKIEFSSRAMRMLGADYGSQWLISDYKQRSEKAKPLIMTFVFEREAESLAAVIVYPSIIITCLTVTCLFLDVRNNVRSTLACFTIFSHYYWLLEIGENIPLESSHPPRLLLYYRGSMVIAVFVLIITLVLNAMCKKDTAPTNVIVAINNFVLTGFAKYLIYPRWDMHNKIRSEDSEFNTNWTNLANVINSLSIIVIIIAYVGMYFSLIPHPIPIIN